MGEVAAIPGLYKYVNIWHLVLRIWALCTAFAQVVLFSVQEMDWRISCKYKCKDWYHKNRGKISISIIPGWVIHRTFSRQDGGIFRTIPEILIINISGQSSIWLIGTAYRLIEDFFHYSMLVRRRIKLSYILIIL